MTTPDPEHRPDPRNVPDPNDPRFVSPQPGYQQSEHQQPGYQQPAYPPPGYAPPGYPQPGYPAGPTGSSNGSGRTAGKWLIWAGAAVLIASIAIGVVLVVTSISSLTGTSSDTVSIYPSGSVTVDAGDSLQLYAAPYDYPECTVTGPAEPAPGPNQHSSFTHEGRQIESFDSMSFPVAGTYTFVCDEQAYAGPPLSIGGIFSVVGGIFLIIFGAGLGIVLLIAGILLRVFARKKV